MSQLRITGVVRLADTVRRALSRPMTVGARDGLRKMVVEHLAQIDGIIRSHGTTPGRLPAPTRRALEFLRSIDWSKVSIGDGDGLEPTPRQMSWKGLTRFLDRMVDWLARATDEKELDEIQGSISKLSRQIEGTIDRERLRPEELAPGARIVRGWVAFFSDRDNLLAYRDALARSRPRIEPAVRAHGYGPEITIEFRPMRHLFKIQPRGARVRVMLPTPMVTFDVNAMDALVALIERRPGARQRVADAIRGEDYQATAAELEALSGVTEHTRGAHHDLAPVFDRVNATYFAGQMSRPHLTWSRTFTGRKMGHYDAIRDIVMISSTLDRADVPEFVVDFLMYHELLHKHLGDRWVNGRRYSHTGEFYELERRFERFGEAEAVLERVAERNS